ncbi:MAG: CHRD domain-containing protein [Rhizobiaceae bacterium]
MTIRSLFASIFFAVAAAGLAATTAHSEMISLSAELSGANEVPPNDSAASGMAEATLDTETRMLSFSVTYEGLSGPAIGAHIHGPVGASGNAGIMIPFSTTRSPIEGSAELTAAQVSDVLGGLTYVNIHTQKHPGGELRGQLAR